MYRIEFYMYMYAYDSAYVIINYTWLLSYSYSLHVMSCMVIHT